MAREDMSIIREQVRALNKRPSNADRIRSFSDEELAEWLANNQDCYACPFFDDGEGICKGGDSCREMMLDWLRQEASDAL